MTLFFTILFKILNKRWKRDFHVFKEKKKKIGVKKAEFQGRLAKRQKEKGWKVVESKPVLCLELDSYMDISKHLSNSNTEGMGNMKIKS